MAINFQNSVSGLQAQSKVLAVSANNVANMSTVGRTGVTQGPDAAYKPQEAVLSSQAGGGVQADVRNVDPASVPAYSPQSPLADDEGMVELPNVNLENEFSNQLLAKRAYQANASVIRTQDEMLSTLLDIKS